MHLWQKSQSVFSMLPSALLLLAVLFVWYRNSSPSLTVNQPVEPHPPLEIRLPPPPQVKAGTHPVVAAQPRSEPSFDPAESTSVNENEQTNEEAQPEIIDPMEALPVINIRWPAVKLEREEILQKLIRCHGLRHALLVDNSTLFRLQDASRIPWQHNGADMSALVRDPSGQLLNQEYRLQTRLRQHHNFPQRGRLVRLFPRAVDVALFDHLGGHSQLGLARVGHIQGDYVLADGQVGIANVTLDKEVIGRPFRLPKIGESCTNVP